MDGRITSILLLIRFPPKIPEISLDCDINDWADMQCSVGKEWGEGRSAWDNPQCMERNAPISEENGSWPWKKFAQFILYSILQLLRWIGEERMIVPYAEPLMHKSWDLHPSGKLL